MSSVPLVRHEAMPCKYCAASFIPKNVRRTYCYSVECNRTDKRLKMRAYNAMVKERDGISPTQKIRPRKSIGQPCTVCGEDLERFGESENPRHTKCRLTGKSLMRRMFEAKIERIAQGSNGGNRVFVVGGCAWCGKHFVAPAGVYCSDNCKTAAKFKRRSSGTSFSVSPRVRQEIYARDRWTCQICAHPVDRTARHPSKWAPTLDHIEPQSAALIPDHSPSNLRLAHSWCNSARGDGSNMAKDVLIARATAMHLEAA